ncbi:MAG: Rdx family protein [Acidimicrobiia bacterium]|nr:MAG: Rdx family protein [Acidimicrobiia bacterium]
MVDALLSEFEQQITDLIMVPSRGGVFEVTVDGELIYSKKETGEHTTPEAILEMLRERG